MGAVMVRTFRERAARGLVGRDNAPRVFVDRFVL